MIDLENQNAIKLLEVMGSCQQRMRDIERLMEDKTGNLGTDSGLRINRTITGRSRNYPGARFFASSQVLPQSNLYIAWRTRFYLIDDQWHTLSNSALNIDHYIFAPAPWCIYITEYLPKSFDNFDELLNSLLEQTDRHFSSAEKLDLQNPLLNTPYEHLYSRIADAHIGAIDSLNLDQSTEELATLRDEARKIAREQHPKESST